MHLKLIAIEIFGVKLYIFWLHITSTLTNIQSYFQNGTEIGKHPKKKKNNPFNSKPTNYYSQQIGIHSKSMAEPKPNQTSENK